MTAAAEARLHIEALIRPSEPLKTAFARIAALIGCTDRRVRQMWADPQIVMRAHELDALRAARAAAAEKAITHELARHAAILDAQASRLALADPIGCGEEIDRLRDLARRARRAAHGDEVTS